ncbi:hypothetical protein [Streptomyces sp. PCS3-D2]|nr:hypothetical protein [Streptomyces sp. PCS3-D2]
MIHATALGRTTKPLLMPAVVPLPCRADLPGAVPPMTGTVRRAA